VFDSGVGGLTVVAALRKVLHGEDILYLGDTARVPYGSKSPDTIVRYSLACARFLIARGVKLLLVACNTASAHAIPALREAIEVPVIGAVEPGARTAHGASRSGHIGVIGTLGTIRSGAYERALRTLNHGATITGQACPLLVPLAEEGWTDGEVTRLVSERYLAELAAKDGVIDTVVLGCTHYPLLAAPIAHAADRMFAHPVTLVDSASAMARAAKELMASEGSLRERSQRGDLHCYVTDASRLDELAERFLGEKLDGFETVDL
jgi:glutamate racemase